MKRLLCISLILMLLATAIIPSVVMAKEILVDYDNVIFPIDTGLDGEAVEVLPELLINNEAVTLDENGTYTLKGDGIITVTGPIDGSIDITGNYEVGNPLDITGLTNKMALLS